MELVQQYLDSIQNIGGVYICKVGRDVTRELIQEIGEGWRARHGKGKPIIFMPEEISVEYERSFDVSIAIIMLKSGYHLRRNETGITLKMFFGGIVGMEDGGSEWMPYRLTDGDLHSNEWSIVEEK